MTQISYRERGMHGNTVLQGIFTTTEEVECFLKLQLDFTDYKAATERNFLRCIMIC